MRARGSGSSLHLVVAVAALALAACQSTSGSEQPATSVEPTVPTVTSEAPVAAPPDPSPRYQFVPCEPGDTVAQFPLSFLASMQSWFEAIELGDVDGAPPLEHPELVFNPARYVGVELLTAATVVARHAGSGDRTLLFVDAEMVEPAREELSAGGRLLFAVDAFGYSTVAASLRADGTVVFFGECAARFTDEVRAAVALANDSTDEDRTEADFLAALLDAPAGAEWQLMASLLDPDSWYAQPADIRSLNHVDVPGGALPMFGEILIVLDVPEAWKAASDAAVCPRIAIGWTVCSPFSRTLVDLPPVAGHGEPVELWLMESFGEYANTFGLIGVLDPAVVTEALFGIQDDLAVLVTIITTGTGNSLATIADDIAAGRVTIDTEMIDYRALVDQIANDQTDN